MEKEPVMSEQWIDYAIKNAVKVHISEIRQGDTILHIDGNIRTVCPNNIKKDNFMGISLFGDTYQLGTIPVKKLIL